jgi:hypothetical protein
VRSTTAIPVTSSNGEIKDTSQSQVQVVLNFAITDYNSQGRTCTRNVYNLSASRNHQGIYMYRSRIPTRDGTVILQAFPPTKITSGLQGDLYQEFQDLEMLDGITKHRFECHLDTSVIGTTRNELIATF